MKIKNIMPDSIRDKEAMNLMKMVDTALYNYNLETCLNTKELPSSLTVTTSTPCRILSTIFTRWSISLARDLHILYRNQLKHYHYG